MSPKQTERGDNIEISPANTYTDIRLGGGVTRQEAAAIWGKSYQAIDRACLRNRLKYRKSLTGGTILITVSSLAELWGNPENMKLWDAFIGSADVTTWNAYEIHLDEKGQTGHDYPF